MQRKIIKNTNNLHSWKLHFQQFFAGITENTLHQIQHHIFSGYNMSGEAAHRNTVEDSTAGDNNVILDIEGWVKIYLCGIFWSKLKRNHCPNRFTVYSMRATTNFMDMLLGGAELQRLLYLQLHWASSCSWASLICLLYIFLSCGFHVATWQPMVELNSHCLHFCDDRCRIAADDETKFLRRIVMDVSVTGVYVNKKCWLLQWEL